MADLVIPGVGGVELPTQEYTTGNLRRQYEAYMKTIKDIFDKGTTTPDDIEQLKKAMQGLKKLLLEGDTTTYPGSRYMMTHEMIYNLKFVFDMLDSNGISPDGIRGDNPIEAIEKWRSMRDIVAIPADPLKGKKAVSWGQLLTSTVGLKVDPTRSLQSMIELEFVKAGNEYYIGKLDKLAEHLEITKKIVDMLAVIKRISNQVKAPDTEINWPPKDGSPKLPKETFDKVVEYMNSKDEKFAKRFWDAYNGMPNREGKVEDPAFVLREFMKKGSDEEAQIYRLTFEFFKKPLAPIPNPSSTAVEELYNAYFQLGQLRGKLLSLGGGEQSTNSLPYFLEKVLGDLNPIFDKYPGNPDNTTKALEKWIMDNQDQMPGKGAGSIQDRINQAMTAAQALNDTQKDELKEVQYIFEQFTRCANTLLQGITKILEGMGKKIAG